jgi:hypothetical protein
MTGPPDESAEHLTVYRKDLKDAWGGGQAGYLASEGPRAGTKREAAALGDTPPPW